MLPSLLLFIALLSLPSQAPPPPSGPAAPAGSLDQLKTKARALAKEGKYADAVPIFQQALQVSEKALGKNHQSTLVLANDLAIAHYSLGDYAAAEPLYLRCIEILESQHGPKHPEVATAVNNLGALYQETAQYEKAEQSFQRSLAITRATSPANSPELATDYNNLAGLYKEMGDYARSEQMYLEAVRIYERNKHRNLPIALLGLGGLYREMGQYDKALPHYERSLQIREGRSGPNHPEVAMALNSLGQFYRGQQELEKAEPFFQRALKIRESVLGKDHPLVASTANNLGSLYEAMGKFDEAETFYRRSLDIRERKLGPDHPDVARSLNNLAGLLNLQDRHEESEKLYARAVRIVEEQPKANPADLWLLVGNLAALQASRGSWDEAVASYDQSRRVVRNYVSHLLPKLAEREQLSFLRARDVKGFHSCLSYGVRRRDDVATVERSAEWLINGKAVTQEALARRALGRAVEIPADAWVSIAKVRDALPADAVLIEIVRLNLRNFEARTQAERWQPPHYIAWIIPPTGKGNIRLIDLGLAQPIDEAVTQARTALMESAQLVRTDGEPDAEEVAIAQMIPLRDMLLKPLLAETGEATKLVVSPDGALWILPWAAIPLDSSTYAIEKYEISHVVCGRDLLAETGEKSSEPAVIFADPDYDLIPAKARELALSLLRGILPKVLQVAPSIKLPPVKRLAATSAEADAVAPKISAFTGKEAVVHKGGNALEIVVKTARRPPVLVISTHGFFLEQQTLPVTDDSPAGDVLKASDGQPLENPLLRCGLLMAGCNPGGPGEDGVLTGLEIVGMNLRGTQLVVLSACETGLGRIQNGEGIAGLRQAFQLAGAHAIVASLWPVEDSSTARLMTRFFTELGPETTAATALRQAQLNIIESRRDRNGAAHPYFWSAFNLTQAGRATP